MVEDHGSSIPMTEIEEYLLANDIEYWSSVMRGFKNPPHIREWYSLINKVIFGGIKRLCIIAARDHAKSEVFAVNTTAWCAYYGMGLGIEWVYIFCDTQPQANDILYRIAAVVDNIYPELTVNAKRWERRDKIFSNGFRVTVRGAEASVRGAHPDLIIGDDVLSDSNSSSNATREKIKSWWRGTVSNMAKSTTGIILEGTVQHQLDLLWTLRENPTYIWKRYPAWKKVMIPKKDIKK